MPNNKTRNGSILDIFVVITIVFLAAITFGFGSGDVEEQIERISENAVEINEKANKILDENEEYRLLVIDLRERLDDVHNELVRCKETFPEEYLEETK